MMAVFTIGCHKTQNIFVPPPTDVPVPILGKANAKPAGPTLVVDEILAYVESKTLTLQDIRSEKLFMAVTGKAIIYTPEQVVSILKDQDIDNSDQAVFEDLMARMLIYTQAEKLKVTQNIPPTTEEEIEGMKAEIKAAGYDYLEFCNLVDTTDSVSARQYKLGKFRSMEQYLFRWKVVEELIKRRIELMVKMTLDTMYSEKRNEIAAKYPGKSDAELKEIFKVRIEKERLKTWIQELRDRSNIVIVREWDRPHPKVAP